MCPSAPPFRALPVEPWGLGSGPLSWPLPLGALLRSGHRITIQWWRPMTNDKLPLVVFPLSASRLYLMMSENQNYREVKPPGAMFIHWGGNGEAGRSQRRNPDGFSLNVAP